MSSMYEYKTVTIAQNLLETEIENRRAFGWSVKSTNTYSDGIEIVFERSVFCSHRKELIELENKFDALLDGSRMKMADMLEVEEKCTLKKALIFFGIGVIFPFEIFDNLTLTWIIKGVLMLIGVGIFAYQKIACSIFNKQSDEFLECAYYVFKQAEELTQAKQ